MNIDRSATRLSYTVRYANKDEPTFEIKVSYVVTALSKEKSSVNRKVQHYSQSRLLLVPFATLLKYWILPKENASMQTGVRRSML